MVLGAYIEYTVANGEIMVDLRGQVRFRFRADEHDVHVMIEGEASWVKKQTKELDLVGVGWSMPIASEVRATNTSGIDIPAYSDEEFSPQGCLLYTSDAADE